MKMFLIIFLCFAITCCKDYAEMELEIKTINATKEFEIIGARDTLIYDIGGLTIINDSTFFISDMIDYKIKQFGNNGKFLFSFGGKGNIPGRFEKAPHKLVYDN